MEFELGAVTIDFQVILDFFAQPTEVIVWELFIIVGWLMLSAVFIYLSLHLLIEYKEEKYAHHWKWVLLAIDIPALNVQTPKAVEQMFAHLAGALDPPDIAGLYRHGFKQRWFSCEIVGIEGYIQFLIRTEQTMRDLVEAAVYAQYPDAEVVEVEDYVDAVPSKYPNDTHDMWAADFALAENTAYPIRTYRDFEHAISKDTVLKDPMGTFLESFSRIGAGEQMWFQILVKPIGNSWKEDAIKVVKGLIGDKSLEHHGSKLVDAMTDAPLKILETIGDEVFGREASVSDSHGGENSGPPNAIQYLSPGQSKLVEGIEEKISKIGFETKMRGIYVARKQNFHPEKGVYALLGAINQFNVPTANSIVPTSGVTASYFYKEKLISLKKYRLMNAYKKRDMVIGGKTCILNIEELATIWHFPMSHVKTPLVQKSSDKMAEPPLGLPIETLETVMEPETGASESGQGASTGGYQTDAGAGYSSGQRFG